MFRLVFLTNFKIKIKIKSPIQTFFPINHLRNPNGGTVKEPPCIFKIQKRAVKTLLAGGPP